MSTDNPTLSRRRELILFLSLALPTVLTNCCRSAIGLTDLSVLGHYAPPAAHANASSPAGPVQPGTNFLAAAGYTICWFTIVSVIFTQGLSAAVNVLSAHAFGAGNIRLLGYYLLVGLTSSTAGASIVAGVSFWAGDVMHYFIGFDATMLHRVTFFSRVTIVGFFPFVWCSVLNAWLMAQKIVRPQLWTYAMSVGANVGLNFLFIYGIPGTSWAGLGFIGSAVATAVSRWLQFFLMLAMTSRLFSGRHSRAQLQQQHTMPLLVEESASSSTFTPPSAQQPRYLAEQPADQPVDLRQFNWSLQAAHKPSRLQKFVKLAGPCALTGVCEDGQLQLVAILAGRIGTVAAATHQGIFNVFWVLSSLMWAVSAGNRVRVANYLGAGDGRGAKFALSVSTMVGLPAAAAVSISLFLARNSIGLVFSDDPKVDHLCAEIMTLCGIAYFALGFFYLSMSTLNATGRPMSVAVSFVFGAWLVCIPLALVFRRLPSSISLFGVPVNGLFGLWLAMSAGYAVTTTSAVVFVCRTDWNKAAELAKKNAEATMQTSVIAEATSIES